MRAAGLIGRALKRAGRLIANVGHAIEHFGRCWWCGDYCERPRRCYNCLRTQGRQLRPSLWTWGDWW